MKRQFAIFAFAAASIVFASCGSSVDQEKIKAETIAIEEATIAVDSSNFEIKKASTELDEALNQL